ncbi:GH23252 [Drosophila grimshawi]|uniref:GH23252 n=1 Tax=Drosophila grimshawi TaxID=7222 RepID=B4K058_DROGR|nr:GH23252 [Drosophila grimshawi]
MGGATHYPYGNHRPTAIDFAVYAGIRSQCLGISERIELNSDHIPLIVEYRVAAALNVPKSRLLPRKANIARFRQRLEELVSLNMELISPADIDDAAELFLRNIKDLRDFRRAAHELRKLLFDIKSKYFQAMLRNADPNKNHGFNLWRTTRCVKRQPLRRIPIMRPDNTWCRSDAETASAFADALQSCFKAFGLASPSQVQDTETFLNADLDPVPL